MRIRCDLGLVQSEGSSQSSHSNSAPRKPILFGDICGAPSWVTKDIFSDTLHEGAQIEETGKVPSSNESDRETNRTVDTLTIFPPIATPTQPVNNSGHLDLELTTRNCDDDTSGDGDSTVLRDFQKSPLRHLSETSTRPAIDPTLSEGDGARNKQKALSGFSSQSCQISGKKRPSSDRESTDGEASMSQAKKVCLGINERAEEGDFLLLNKGAHFKAEMKALNEEEKKVVSFCSL